MGSKTAWRSSSMAFWFISSNSSTFSASGSAAVKRSRACSKSVLEYSWSRTSGSPAGTGDVHCLNNTNRNFCPGLSMPAHNVSSSGSALRFNCKTMQSFVTDLAWLTRHWRRLLNTSLCTQLACQMVNLSCWDFVNNLPLIDLFSMTDCQWSCSLANRQIRISRSRLIHVGNAIRVDGGSSCASFWITHTKVFSPTSKDVYIYINQIYIYIFIYICINADIDIHVYIYVFVDRNIWFKHIYIYISIAEYVNINMFWNIQKILWNKNIYK